MGIDNLLTALWHDFDHPDFWWQIGLLLLCLGIVKFVERFVRGHQLSVGQSADAAWRLGQGGLKRITFPLLALLLVIGARALLRGWHPVNLLSIAIPLLFSLAVIRAVFYVLRYSFNPSGWLANFERGFALLVWGLVALHIVGLLPQVIDLLEAVSFPVGKQKLNLWLVAQGIVTVVATLLIALWLSGLVESRLAGAQDMDANLRVVFSRLTKAVLIVLAVMIGLPLVGIDLTTLSVFGGALGVGLGFGLQKIASNYVSGFIILLDRSIRIGNVIAVAGERGQVTRITTRYTVLKAATGVEAIIPNEVLVGSVVLNESSADQRVRFPLRVQVSYAGDVEQAMRLMEEAASAQPRVLAEPLPKASIVEFADNGITLELGFWIADSQVGTIALRSDINLAIWKAFGAAGIEIPYPQRDIRLINGAFGGDYGNGQQRLGVDG
ncbi:mechanosensitive ion channel family protein [Georgfuchsia toluolica]|nr:mechanosensitive ion channel domain-containing protein [Georgfuchsia toluolica]